MTMKMMMSKMVSMSMSRPGVAGWTVSALLFLSLGGLPSCQSTTPEFVDLNGTPHRPLEFRGARAHVLIFITDDCPVANGYAPEIRSLVAEYSSRGIEFFLVHVDPDLTREKANQHARDYTLPGAVIIDSRHDLVRHTGVRFTPEAAVLNPAGDLVYRGRIDNLYAELGKKRRVVSRRDLRDVLSALLAGKPIETARTEAVGCFIPELN